MKKYSHYKVVSISRYSLDPGNVKKLRKEGRVSHKSMRPKVWPQKLDHEATINRHLSNGAEHRTISA